MRLDPAHAGDPPDAEYVVVVVDSMTGEIDSYGPLLAPDAERMIDDLRDLFDTTGIEEVAIAVGRMHPPGGGGHPEDP